MEQLAYRDRGKPPPSTIVCNIIKKGRYTADYVDMFRGRRFLGLLRIGRSRRRRGRGRGRGSGSGDSI